MSIAASLGRGRARKLIEHASTKDGWLSEVRSWDSGTWLVVLRVGVILMAAFTVFFTFLSLPPDPGACAEAGRCTCDAGVLCSAQKTVFFFLGLLKAEDLEHLPWVARRFGLFPAAFAAIAVGLSFLPRVNRMLRRWLVVLRGGHVIVADTSNVDVAVATAYRQLGRQVLVVAPALTPAIVQLEGVGASFVAGNPTDPKVLRKAGLNRAFALFSLAGQDGEALPLCNAVAATLKEGDGKRQQRLLMFIRVGHRAVRGFVEDQARRFLDSHGVDLRLYERELGIARSVLNRFPVDWGRAPGPFDLHAVIVGFGRMGHAMLQQLVQVGVSGVGRRSVVTVIDRNATSLGQSFLASRPELGASIELRFLDADLTIDTLAATDMRRWFAEPVPATGVYLCRDGDLDNLTLALGLRRELALAGIAAPPFFLHQPGEAGRLPAIPSLQGRIDTLRMMPFGDIIDDADPTYLLREEGDLLARHIHERYLARLGEGQRDPNRPSHQPWERLPVAFRDSSRAQADFRAMLLRVLGTHPAIPKQAQTFAVPVDRLEELSELEHLRWCRERRLAGWTLGAATDTARQVSKDLVAYAALDEAAKSKDRGAILEFPGLLGELGIGLKRDLRIGLWFESHAVVAPALVGKIVEKLQAAAPATSDLHLQLVLPLRQPVELHVAARLADLWNAGIDVAIPRRSDGTVAAACAHPELVDAMVSCADRAFDLHPAPEQGEAEMTACVVALGRVCDRVLVVSETAATVEALVGQARAAGCANLDLMTL